MLKSNSLGPFILNLFFHLSKNTSNLLTVLFICLSTSSLASSLLTPNISLSEMTKDIHYLANDKLKGRANFSPELNIAADYISQRFSEIGLKTFNGLTSYKQNFTLTQITPAEVFVSLNNQIISPSNLATATKEKTFSWANTENIKTHIIDKNKNLRYLVRKINNEGGQHLILVNEAHEKLFKRYQDFFNQGLIKLNLASPSTTTFEKQNTNAIVLILTNITDVKQLNVQVKNKFTTKTLSNVVGVLPGKNKANEVVLFSAHYDHLGITADGNEIYNGADDNASGTTAVIQLAQYFSHVAKQENNRTLIFVAFSAEEMGGYGSRYFSQQVNPEDITAMINIEMVGKPSKFGSGTLWMTGMEHSNLGELLNKSLAPRQMQIFKDPYPKQQLFYRSDNATLARLGVPAHSFSSTQLDKDKHYHQTSDELSTIDLNSMYIVIETLSIATENLVNGTITPTRVDVTKVNSYGKIF